MTVSRTSEYLCGTLRELLKLSQETEWVEFKRDSQKPEMICEYISALANSSALLGKQNGYVVWGVDDGSHDVVGTSFKPRTARHKQQELESWLLQKIAPKVNFSFFEFGFDGHPVVILEIQAATHTPVSFEKTEYIRIFRFLVQVP
jgi:predicted HTH transcriptional regulator